MSLILVVMAQQATMEKKAKLRDERVKNYGWMEEQQGIMNEQVRNAAMY